MLILTMKPGHDGAVSVIQDRRLIWSLESEKNSNPRYAPLNPQVIVDVARELGRVPDVVAVGGWQDNGFHNRTGGGYAGVDEPVIEQVDFFGQPIQYFSSSHERSHLFCAIGMAPRSSSGLEVVLVWEGVSGTFYLVEDGRRIVRRIDVMHQPGSKYAAVFALCDPAFRATGGIPRLNDAGKLMALAAFDSPADADPSVVAAVERVLALPDCYPLPKDDFRDTPLFNCGVESSTGKLAAAVVSDRLFRRFAEVAVRELPSGLPLRIAGGCGLNCDWNSLWLGLGHFSDVFVPPCANDSGSAIGTGIDALTQLTGEPHIEWDVYSGLEFENDVEPSATLWRSRKLDVQTLAEQLRQGAVIAWAQGRWEIGPRALGNRSLLAEPFSAATKDRLNAIKQREDYRPIAPCARVEDLSKAFDQDFEDPFMLYFRRVKDERLQAVTHVDGTARCQTVSSTSNPRLHTLLTAFGAATGLGVLCNTSLNFSGAGFVNRLSDLTRYCEDRGVDGMVVGDTWYQRI